MSKERESEYKKGKKGNCEVYRENLSINRVVVKSVMRVWVPVGYL